MFKKILKKYRNYKSSMTLYEWEALKGNWTFVLLMGFFCLVFGGIFTFIIYDDAETDKCIAAAREECRVKEYQPTACHYHICNSCAEDVRCD